MRLSIYIFALSLILGLSTVGQATNNSSASLQEADATLNQVYRDLKKTRTPKAQKTLLKTQKEWLKKRDTVCKLGGLPDSRKAWLTALAKDKTKRQCVIKETQDRIARLRANQMTPPEVVFTHKTQNIYPPYTEVWHRKIPEPREIYPSALHYGKSADGDIVILYARLPVKRPEDRDRSQGTIHFFSGDHFPNIGYKQYAKQTKPAYPKQEIKLANGKTIKRENLDHRIPLRCPQELNSYFVITDANGQSVRKSLLYILDKPQRHTIQERCADTSERSFDAKVEAIQGDFWLLDDGTFLVKDGNGGIVIRFDPDLKTKSPLFNRQFFWVDPKEIEGFHSNGNVVYQAMHEAILARLRKLQEANQ